VNARETLTPPVIPPGALISFGKSGTQGGLHFARNAVPQRSGFFRYANYMRPSNAGSRLEAISQIDTLVRRGITPANPPKANRKPPPRACDFALYRERNLVERFFNKRKHFRAISTRGDKFPQILLAGVQTVSAIIRLN
jgi:hypothetical protein